MANIISNWWTNTIDRIAAKVADQVLTDSGRVVAQARAYRMGSQPRALKVKDNQYDDNLILNYTGLIVDRDVSQLIGKGIDFKFGDGQAGADEKTAQEVYLRAFWDANKQEILLHRASLSASEAGTGYFVFMPAGSDEAGNEFGGVIGEDGKRYTRLSLLDPAFVEMETLPEDFEIVVKYTVQYKFADADGKDQARKIEYLQNADNSWTIIYYDNINGKWVEVNRIEWQYACRPVVHWQNLPSIDSPYGISDMPQSQREAQNKINGDASFLSKSLRLGSDPLRWFKGTQPPQRTEVGPDKAVYLGMDGEAGQLPPVTDWPGQIEYLKTIKGGMFEIARTVDTNALVEAGDLTNFRVKVVYQDNEAKIDTKRELFGDALEEVNRCVLIIAGMEPIHTEVIWPDFVPVNKTEIVQMVSDIQTMGVISKQTAFEVLRQYKIVQGTWEDEQKLLEDEQTAEDNLGAALLRSAMRGKERGVMPELGNTGGRVPPG